MSQTLTQQFDKILEKGSLKEIKPLLQDLDSKGRKEILKAAKDNKHLWESDLIQTGNSYKTKPRGTEAQKEILLIALFVTASKKEFQSQWSTSWALKYPLLKSLLQWHIPSWIGDYLNEPGEWPVFSYMELMELQADGYMTLQPEVVALTLPQAVRENAEQHKFRKKLDNLLKHEQTWKEHIWLLFHYDSQIHWLDNYVQYQKAPAEQIWIEAFKFLIEKEKVAKREVLKQAILASNRNFNQTLSGWFIGLFEALDPSVDDLLALQDDLLSVFISPHSKVVNVSLKKLKLLMDNPAFKVEDYLNAVSVLLGSEVKSIVKAVLVSFDKILKKRKEAAERITELAVMVLSNTDDDIQVRASKFIAKYGTASVESQTALYWDTVRTNSREILKDFEPTNTELPTEEENRLLEAEVDLNLSIEYPKNMEDLVFLLTQALENTQPYQIDLALAGLIEFAPSISNENIQKLEPVFDRANKLLTSQWASRTGYVDLLFANFIADCAQQLKKRFSVKARHLNSISSVSIKVSSPVYHVYKELFRYSLELIRVKSSLPLLSTPTHEPHWIDAKTLIDRLKKYQELRKEPNSVDFQTAILRLNKSLSASVDDLSIPKKWLHPIKYFLGDSEVDLDKSLASTTAKIIINPVKLKEMEVRDETFKVSRWDFEAKRMKKVNSTISKMYYKLDVPPSKSGNREFLSTLLKAGQTKGAIVFSHKFNDEFWVMSNDILRLLSTTPNYLDIMIGSLLQKILIYNSFHSESDKKALQNTLMFISESWPANSELANLLIGSSMMSSDGVSRSLARDIWIDQVLKNGVDNDRIGYAVSRFNELEFAPLKRFTDLAKDCYGISRAHKREMGTLLHSYLHHLRAETAPKNLKVVISILLECRDEIEITQHVKDQLKKLATSTTRPLIKKL